MIVLYKGARGRGKTLTMIKDSYNYYLNNWDIYSNMKSLKFAKYLSNEFILKIDKKEKKLYNCVLVIDEIQTLFDSRNSSTKESRNFSYFIQQIRKRDIILLTTTQFSNTMDKRLRQHIDIIVNPKFLKKYDVCEVFYVDLRTIEDMEIGLSEPESCKLVYNAEKIFGLYDTKELIN